MDKVLNLKNIVEIESFSSHFARLGDLYVLSHFKSEDNDSGLVFPDVNTPLRLNGLLFVMVHKGKLSMEVNTETFQNYRGNIMVVRPGTLISLSKTTRPCSFTVLFVSTTFLNNVNIDTNNIELTSIFSHPTPVMNLDPSEAEVVKKYIDLLDANASVKTESVLATRIAETLIAALLYELLRFSFERLVSTDNVEQITRNEGTGKNYNYVYKFLQLLHLNYSRQRKSDYYARALCITPKYLSAITKEFTGLSATDWINRVVVQEAKNMLRFSDKNIQEVAYALNFPSQSAFGKYFKRLTGQSPALFLKN